MEKKRTDDYEPGPVPSPRALDRFGFVKQDVNTSDGLVKSRSANECERYFVFLQLTFDLCFLFFFFLVGGWGWFLFLAWMHIKLWPTILPLLSSIFCQN